MKRLPMFISIPLLVVLLVLAVVFFLRTRQVTTSSTPTTSTYQLPQSSGDKPKSGFSTGTSTKSGTPGDTADLTKDLQTTADDGGASDIKDLQNASSGL